MWKHASCSNKCVYFASQANYFSFSPEAPDPVFLSSVSTEQEGAG